MNRLVTTTLGVLTALLVTAAAARGDDRARLVGSWFLVSMETRSAEGVVTHPYGENAEGRLIYDPSGNMIVQLMRKNRPLLGPSASLEEIKAAYRSSFSYYGT